MSGLIDVPGKQASSACLDKIDNTSQDVKLNHNWTVLSIRIFTQTLAVFQVSSLGSLRVDHVLLSSFLLMHMSLRGRSHEARCNPVLMRIDCVHMAQQVSRFEANCGERGCHK